MISASHQRVSADDSDGHVAKPPDLIARAREFERCARSAITADDGTNRKPISSSTHEEASR